MSTFPPTRAWTYGRLRMLIHLTRSPMTPDIRIRRLALMSELQNRDSNSILVSPVTGLLHRVLPPRQLRTLRRTLQPGSRIELREFQGWASRVGYRRVPMVQEPGEVAFRGSIIDIFPPAHEKPVRLDLFDVCLLYTSDAADDLTRVDLG